MRDRPGRGTHSCRPGGAAYDWHYRVHRMAGLGQGSGEQTPVHESVPAASLVCVGVAAV
jgi:hypothetical protein